jgi:hypothetical protein
MKTQLTYKRINGEDFILMATYSTKEEAKKKSHAYRSKYGRTRVIGKQIFCQQ